MAVALREYGTQNFARVLKFMYTVPLSMKETLIAWIVVAKRRQLPPRNLFKHGSEQAVGVKELMAALEPYLTSKFHVLSLG